MGANLKDQVDALLARNEPPELDGMPRGLDPSGALHKAIEASIKYWNAWRDCQQQLIDLEDEKERMALASLEIERREKRTRRARQVIYGAAAISVVIAIMNLSTLFW